MSMSRWLLSIRRKDDWKWRPKLSLWQVRTNPSFGKFQKKGKKKKRRRKNVRRRIWIANKTTSCGAFMRPGYESMATYGIFMCPEYGCIQQTTIAGLLSKFVLFMQGNFQLSKPNSFLQKKREEKKEKMRYENMLKEDRLYNIKSPLKFLDDSVTITF